MLKIRRGNNLLTADTVEPFVGTKKQAIVTDCWCATKNLPIVGDSIGSDQLKFVARFDHVAVATAFDVIDVAAGGYCGAVILTSKAAASSKASPSSKPAITTRYWHRSHRLYRLP